jgi:hypothetical protein
MASANGLRLPFANSAKMCCMNILLEAVSVIEWPEGLLSMWDPSNDV